MADKVGTYRLAGVIVRVESVYGDVHELCRDYRVCAEPDICVRVTQDDIDFERQRSTKTDARLGRRTPDQTDGYLETLATYRKVAEVMPTFDTMLVHGSCIAVDGWAYLFCAQSGTGKSTHARMWRALLGERALMVNDDKPLLQVREGRVIAFGTPWDGKHRLSTDVAMPLRAICLLRRDDHNHIEMISREQARTALLRHVYRPLDAGALALTMPLVDELARSVSLWQLGCLPTIEAAEVSFAAMSERGQHEAEG